MSKLYISEYADLASGVGSGGTAQIVSESAVATQVVDFSGGVVSSNAFNARTRIIRIHTDAICSVRFDGSASTTSHMRMVADQTEYFGVQPGSKLSVIANT